MLEILVRETIALGPEQQRRAILIRQLGDLGRHVTWGRELPVIRPRARRRPRDEGAIGNRLGERRHNARACEYVIRPRSQGVRFGMRKRTRSDQHQVAETHVLHGARDRTDIARVAGIDQDDANGSAHALLF